MHTAYIVAICGPSGAGKSHLAMALAELQGTERAGRIVAAQRFKEVRYVDDATRGILQQAAHRHANDLDLRDAIFDALQVMGQESP